MLNSIPHEPEKELLTIEEAAEILGLNYFHARKILLGANIDCYQYGRKRLWHREAILKLKEQHRVKAMEN